MARTHSIQAVRAGSMLLLLLLPLVGCASVEHSRLTESSGTFRSEAWAVTFLAWDLPRGSEQVARDNAFDAGLPNLEVQRWQTSPNWGWWNWVLDILSVRKTVIEGTWGYDGQDLSED